jgi:hypothetical protein
MKRHVLRASLVLALFPVIAFAQVPEPDAGSLGASFLVALASKNYGLLLSIALLAAVWVARAVGGRVWPAIATPRGSAILAVLGGTLALLVGGLGAGQEFSLGLLLNCVTTALAASGMWSAGKALGEKKPDVTQSAMPVCSAADIANGKPGCV